VSAGQFSRRTFLKTTGAATAGAIVATSLPTAAHAAPADSAAAVGFSSDGNPFITNIYTADPDAFADNGRFYFDTDRDLAPLGANDFVMTASGDATDVQAEELVTSATLLSSTILQSASS
jgi:hypothetical protein